MRSGERITLFLTGDVMTGRGVDQILPHPCDPRLFESYVTSAAGYVALAEEANGPVPKAVDFAYVWGDALTELDRRKPDTRLINLETAVTTSEDAVLKGINYRMNPGNAPVIAAVGVDACMLANNHVLDWGEAGLRETLETLARIGVSRVGAGRTLEEAAAPAILPVSGGNVIVFAFGSPTSGVPSAWAATENRPGVNFLPEPSPEAVDDIAAQVKAVKKTGNIVLVSLHWGGNWGYEISPQQRAFAHGLIDDASVDVVWGHSSHHPKGIEVHNGKLVLYGCGDFLDDYEGIRGYEEFRDDLVLMYFPTIAMSDGALLKLSMVPLQIRNFRLNRASRADAEWLRDMLNREGSRFGTGVELGADNTLTLEWEREASGAEPSRQTTAMTARRSKVPADMPDAVQLERSPLYSEELGIDLTRGRDADTFRWFLASILFGARISETIATNTYFALVEHGLTSPRKILDAGWEFLVNPVMREGGYVRYDGRKSEQLLRVSRTLLDDYQGSMSNIEAAAKDGADLEARIDAFYGVGPVTVNIFLRELRPFWEKADPEPLPSVRKAARKLKIDLDRYDRKSLTFARVEAGLIRLRHRL